MLANVLRRNLWGHVSGSSYTGLGDVVSVDAFWGLRAYSAAKCGTAAIRVRRSSDSTEMDIATLSSGDLDVTTATSFAASSTLTLSKVYDQTGNARDWAQSSASLQPVLDLSGGPSGKPYIARTSGQWLAYQSAISGATNTAVLGAVTLQGSGTGNPDSDFLAGYSATDFQYGWASSTSIDVGNGAALTVSGLTASAWAATAAMFGSSGVVAANGNVSGAGSSGGNTVGASGIAFGYYDGGTISGSGNLTEAYYCKTGAGSFAYATAIANQRSYWGI